MGDTGSQKGAPPPCPRHGSPGRNLGIAGKAAKSHLCPAVGTAWKSQAPGEGVGLANAPRGGHVAQGHRIPRHMDLPGFKGNLTCRGEQPTRER